MQHSGLAVIGVLLRAAPERQINDLIPHSYHPLWSGDSVKNFRRPGRENTANSRQ